MTASSPRRPEAIDAEERALWEALHGSGSDAARQSLFARYQPLARRIAWRFMRDDPATPVELAELIQLASIGLLEAIDRYRPQTGVPFRYYCPRRIGGAIADGLALHSEVNQQITTARRIKRERIRSLSARSGEAGNLDAKLDLIGDIAAELALGLMLEDSSLFLKDDRDASPDAYESLAWKQALKHLRAVVDSLDERERQIVMWHYLEGVPFEQIAGLLGVTKGRVSQIHKAALALMRKRLSVSGLLRLEG